MGKGGERKNKQEVLQSLSEKLLSLLLKENEAVFKASILMPLKSVEVSEILE